MTPCCPTSVHEQSKVAGCYSPEWLAHKFLAIQPGDDGPDLELRNCRVCGSTLAIELPRPAQTAARMAGEAAARRDRAVGGPWLVPPALLSLFRAPLADQLAELGITDPGEYARAVGDYSSGYHRAARKAQP